MSVAGFISSQRTEHDVPHALSCRVLGVSQSWFYKWRDRPLTPRQARQKDLDAAITKFFTDSHGTYGSPRVWLDLRDDGWKVSVNTVAAGMAALGLVGRRKKRRRSLTKPGRKSAAADHVRPKLHAPAPNVL